MDGGRGLGAVQVRDVLDPLVDRFPVLFTVVDLLDDLGLLEGIRQLKTCSDLVDAKRFEILPPFHKSRNA